ncbi:MAG: c-type cytochrome [bacterium]
MVIRKTIRIGSIRLAGFAALVGRTMAVALLLSAMGSKAGLAQSEREVPPGKGVYLKNCAHCHGDEGDGKGHAYDAMYPRPRDLTSGMFKFRRTESGEAPLRDDLVQMIRDGMPGTGMPPWKEVLSSQEIRQAAEYIQGLYTDEEDEAPKAEPIGKPPPASPESIARGRELFIKLECNRCHGEAGRGDGNNAMNLTEDWNNEPIYPRNLTAGWVFRGGRRPTDIYRNILFGLNGTPMPAHVEEELLAQEADRWALVHYVLSLGPDSEPPVRSTILVKYTGEAIPLDASHPLWAQSESFYIPLAGQVILKPRLFQPSVRYLWVEALYNDEEIGFRMRWVDPTAIDSEAFKGAKKPKKPSGDGEENEGDKETAKPSVPYAGDPEPVDELMLQFPLAYKVAEPLPYFLMGKPGKPVVLWVWRSDREGMVEAKATRLGAWKEQSGTAGLQSAVTHHQGQYTLVVKRKRLGGKERGPRFLADPGLMPISFSVVDGFKGEGGTRRAVATWFTLLLEQRVEDRIFYLPFIVALVIFGLEWRLLTRARKAAEDEDTQSG